MLVSTHRHFFYVITFRIFSFEYMKETIKSKTLRQQATFSCSPLELYEILMNSKKHGEITGGKAKISNKIPGQFEVFDGYVHGYNIELVPGKKIIQAWHFSEDGWPEDHFSICTFQLNKIKGGTKLIFTQKGIPIHKYTSLQEGWKQYYWESLKRYLLK